MAQKYIKKPIIIEAIQLTDLNAVTICDWINKPIANHNNNIARILSSLSAPKSIVIETLEGYMAARPGDWIIKGTAGEFYPCKSDIFKETYQQVEA